MVTVQAPREACFQPILSLLRCIINGKRRDVCAKRAAAQSQSLTSQVPESVLHV
jgi:hypothetical protein